MSWVYELNFGVATHRQTQISKLIFLYYIDFIEKNHLGQFYQNSIIYFVKDLLTDKPIKLFSFQNHFLNDI